MTFSRAGRTSRPLGMLAAALAVLVLASGDGTSEAGIQGSGFNSAVVRGPIGRFGSIFVNGTEYDISGASIHIDGAVAAESQLRVGQVVTVKANINAAGTAGVATDVAFASDVLGPVAQVNLAGGTITILGQKIRLLPDTLLDPALPLGGILGLVPGIKLRVSGFPNASGEIEATRIDLVIGGPSTVRMSGVVQALDTSAHTFRVNSETVDYSEVTPVGTLANGSTVSVAGPAPSGQAALHATSVDVVAGVGGAPGDGGDVAGLISAFSAPADFIVGAQRVVTTGTTQFLLHGQTLGPNLAVEVRGYFDSNGSLVANDVEATGASGLVGVLGAVESVSASDHTLRVLGVNFSTSDATAFDDQAGQGVRPFALADVHVGDYVEIRGPAPGALGTSEATLVRRDDAGNDFYLEGTALQVLAPRLRVLGVQVITTSQTDFPGNGLLASLQFFLQAPNRMVRVHGTQSGSTLIAQQIEFVQ